MRLLAAILGWGRPRQRDGDPRVRPRPAVRRVPTGRDRDAHARRSDRRRAAVRRAPAEMITPLRSGQRRFMSNFLSIASRGSILSVGSDNSILSAGSSGSVLSIGSVGSIGSAFSVGSAGSAASLFSAGSVGSIMSAGRRRAILNRVVPQHRMAPIAGALVAAAFGLVFARG